MNNSFDINAQINNAINSRGNIVHEVINQNVALLTAKISQSGISSRPSISIMDQNFPSTVVLTRTYVSQGVYTLNASEPIFGENADKFYAENFMYFDIYGTLSIITFVWVSSTSLSIEVFDTTNSAKDIEQNDVPFKLYAYPS